MPCRSLGEVFLKLAFAAVAVYCAASLSCTKARAADVLVVRSEDSAPVLEAQRAVVEGLANRGASTRTVGLEELRVEETGGERVWLAIGEHAAARVHEMRRPDISIAHCLVSDPAYLGLDPFEFPGVTGSVPMASQLRLIKEMLPEAKVIGVLVRSGSEEARERVYDLLQSVPEGWSVETVAISAEDSFAAAVNELLERPIDLVWTFPDEALYDANTTKALLRACLRKRKPVYGYSKDIVQAGALFGMTMDSLAQGRAAAELVYAMLSHPGMGPRAAQRLSAPRGDGTIAVNLAVAKSLGREIPAMLVHRAKYVVAPE
jgi:putative ABC transport system substrate-binding protein